MTSAAHAAPDYSDAPDPVRDDLRATHARLLEHMSRPGRWLNAEQRVAIAEQSRHSARCKLCEQRLAALSPAAVSGEHERSAGGGALPEAWVEIAHRVRSDPGRLSRAWFEERLGEGVSIGEYVEIVGLVAFTAGLDFFCRSLGIEAFALPAPQAGEPPRETPDGLHEGIAWVPVMQPGEVPSSHGDLFLNLTRVPNIARALSAVPEHVYELRDAMGSHYLGLREMADPQACREIDRLQMELIASRVSALNECFY